MTIFEVLIFRRDADNAVGNAELNDGDLAVEAFDVFELGEIERVAAEPNPHFLPAQRPVKDELLVLRVVRADPHIGRIHQRLGAHVFAAPPTIAVK